MAVKPIPESYHTVTPHLIVADAARQIEFLKRAFGARERHVMRAPDGTVVHADLVVGDSHVMIGKAREPWKPFEACLYVYVPDCDAVYRDALAAGATSITEPANQFYGDRHGGVVDAAGNQWWIATHVEDVSDEELHRRAAATFGSQAGQPTAS